jgi:hypothetical protein
MPDPVSPLSPAASAVQTHLRTTAQILHQVEHLGPDGQKVLAELVEELGNALDSAAVPSNERAHLTECAAHFVQLPSSRTTPEGWLPLAIDWKVRSSVSSPSSPQSLPSARGWSTHWRI